MRTYSILSILILLIVSCEGPTFKDERKQTGQELAQSSSAQGYQQITIEEVIQVREYTYLKVKENNQSKWLSVPTMEASVGEQYFYKGGTVMKGFESKSLNRTFESILFLKEITKNPNKTEVASIGSVEPTKIKPEDIQVAPVQGGITLSELMNNKQKYEGKEVLISGIVMKYNEAIMNTNWIHIQDGSGGNEVLDLTLTSTAKVRVGDTVVVKGVVTLNKDFGAGYKYDVIIENAKLTKVRKI